MSGIYIVAAGDCERCTNQPVCYRKTVACLGECEVDLGAQEDIWNSYSGGRRLRVAHESLPVRYQKTSACLGEYEVDLGAPEDCGRRTNHYVFPSGSLLQARENARLIWELRK